MKFRRVVFLFLLTLFVALSVLWLFYLPYDRKTLYRAIPAGSVFISEHENVAGRWQDVATNGLALSLLKSLGGMEEADVRDMVEDPGTVAIVKRLGRKDTIVAYVPYLGPGRRPAWVLASWVGGGQQTLKLMAQFGMVPGLKSQKIGGRKIWLLEFEEGESEQQLSFAIVEGVLLACLADEPLVQYMAERLDRGSAIIPELRERLDEGPTQSDTLMFDRGWIDWGWLSQTRVESTWRYNLDLSKSQSTELFLSGEYPFPEAAPLAENVDWREIGQILGNAPALFISLPFSYVDAFVFGEEDVAPIVRAIGRMLEDAASDKSEMFACLAGGNYSGRLLGLKVPTILAAVELENKEGALDRISASMDDLNREYRIGLVPGRTEVCGYQATALGLSRDDLFASLKQDDRPVFAVVGNWLVFSSNVGALGKILSDGKKLSASESAVAPNWSQGADAVSNLSAYAWIDMKRSGKILKDIIAVYKLSMIMNQGGSDSRTRKQLDNMQGWIDAAASLDTFRAWLVPNQEKFNLRIELGHP